MSAAISIDGIVERLRGVLRSETLNEAQSERANELLRRLETPVRVVFLGLSEPDQPRIINALLGRDVIPNSVSRPPQKITFATIPSITVNRADGTTETLQGEAAPVPADSLFLQRTCEADVLRQFSVLDLAVSGTQANFNGAVRWAAARADIAVWCSKTFAEQERALWRGVPDKLKDHSFLALTGDSDGMRTARLRTELAGDFLDIVPVGGKPGASGLNVHPLADAIRQHVEEGRHADAGSALFFLRKIEHRTAGAKAPARVESRPVTASVVEFKSAEPGRTFAPDSAAPVNEEWQAALRSACAFIKERAVELLALLPEGGPHDRSEFVAHCGETIRQISSILDSVPTSTEPAFVALSDALLDAEELVVLLEIETDGMPDIDAACVLLQLRQELEASVAA